MAEAGATSLEWKGLSKGKLEALKGKLKGKGKEELAALIGKGKSKQKEQSESGKGKGDPPAPAETPAEIPADPPAETKQPVPEAPANSGKSGVGDPAASGEVDTRYKLLFQHIHDFLC